MPHGSDIITFHHYYEYRNARKKNIVRPESATREVVEQSAAGGNDVEAEKEVHKADATGTVLRRVITREEMEHENEWNRRDHLGPGC